MEVKINAYIHIFDKKLTPEILESEILFPAEINEDIQSHLQEDVLCHLSQLGQFNDLQEGKIYNVFGTAILTHSSNYSEYYGAVEYDSDLELCDDFKIVELNEAEIKKRNF